MEKEREREGWKKSDVKVHLPVEITKIARIVGEKGEKVLGNEKCEQNWV